MKESHALIGDGARYELESWDWADVMHDVGKLVWSQGGVLRAVDLPFDGPPVASWRSNSALSEHTVLLDTTGMDFERRVAPYADETIFVESDDDKSCIEVAAWP